MLARSPRGSTFGLWRGQDVHPRTGVPLHRASPVGTTGPGDGWTLGLDYLDVIQGMGRRLRHTIDRDDERPPTFEELAPWTDAGPFVDFVAYADDCTLSGQIRLGTERLTDLLNGRDEWQLIDVMAESFDGEELVESKQVAIPRDEIVVVHATGPRGNHERRYRTNLHPVIVQAGRFGSGATSTHGPAWTRCS